MILPARRKALCRALLATTAACGLAAPMPAHAQTPGSVPPPPVRQAVDENGVDVVRGTFNAAQPSVSIGPAYPHGLVYSATNSGSGWFNGANSLIHQSGSTFTVSVGGRSDSFTQSGASFVPTEADGSSLVQSGALFTYTSRDGLVATFTLNTGGRPFWDATVARATSITYPDGSRIHFHHKIVQYCPGGEEGDPPEVPLTCPTGYKYVLRLQSITNNHGYQLKFSYASNTLDDRDPATDYESWSRVGIVRAINNAVDYCAPAGDSCPAFTQSWPYLWQVAGTNELNVYNPAGEATRFTYSADGITGIRRPGAADDTVEIEYAAGKVSKTTIGEVEHLYAYSDNGTVRTTTVTAPDLSSRVYTSDTAKFRVTAFRDELNRTTAYDYDSSGRPTKVTAPEGNYTQLTYDSRGNVTQSRAVAKPGSGLADIVASAAFPSTCTNQKTCNQPTSTTDPRGNTTDYTYDSTHGGPLTVTLPAPSAGAVRPQTRFAYAPHSAYYKDSTGAIVLSAYPVHLPVSTSACQTLASCAGAADEAKTSIAWGPQSPGTPNNLLPVSSSSGSGDGALTATVAMTYDNLGNLLSADGPLAGADDTVTFRYDPARRNIGTISPDPDGAGPLLRRARRTTLTNGLVTKVERGTVTGTSDSAWAAFAPLDAVETGYDAQFRPATSKLTAGGTTYALTQVKYDDRGRVECTAQRMNPATFASPEPNACLPGAAQASFGSDRIVKTIYDDAGQVAQVLTAVGVTGLEAAEVTAAYTDNGRPFTLTDGEGNKTTFEHDGHDRLARTRFPSPSTDGQSSTTDYEQPSYDANGNVTAIRNRAAETIAFTFDALNRPTLKNLPGSEPDVTYSYDLLGRMTGASQTGHALAFTFDALGRNLTQSGPLGTVSYQYDLAGRRTRLTYPGSGLYVDYDNLLTGEVAKIRENGATSGAGVLATFAYDNLGRRTSLTRGNGTVTSYAYDNASRLTQLVQDLAGTTNDLTLGFTHNPAGQIATATRSNDLYSLAKTNASATWSHDGLNRITAMTIPPTTFPVTHDARGNLATMGGNSFAYDSQNRLTSLNTNVMTLAFDPAERLFQTVHNAVTTTRFAYDGTEMIAEHDGANGLLRRYVHGPGVDEPLVWYEGSGTSTRRWFHADERGSVIAVSDAAGALHGTINRYDEFGAPSAALTGRFGYTGQAALTPLTLFHYKARIYYPGLGRFIQPDPIKYDDGLNLYAYVRNDPINLVDPTGLNGCGASDWDEPQVCGQAPCAGFWMGLICILNFDLLRGPGTGGRNGDPSGGGTGGGTSPTQPIEDLLDEIRRKAKKALCAAANAKGESLRIGADYSLYLGGGIRLGMGLTYNKSTGQFVWDKYFGGGMGLGATAGVGFSTSQTIAEPGRRGNLDVNVDVGLGVITGSYTNNLSTIDSGGRSGGTGGSGAIILTKFTLGGAGSLNMTLQDNTEVGSPVRCEGGS